MAALCGCNYITVEHTYAIRYAWQPGIREVAILPSSVMDWVWCFGGGSRQPWTGVLMGNVTG
jgi:hypothetical protein